MRRRLDLGMTRKAAARILNANEGSLENWERGRTEPAARLYPALIDFVGYNPLPAPTTTGQAVRRERLTRGLSQDRLARRSGVDPATVARLEADTPRMGRRPVVAVLKFLGIDWQNGE